MPRSKWEAWVPGLDRIDHHPLHRSLYEGGDDEQIGFEGVHQLANQIRITDMDYLISFASQFFRQEFTNGRRSFKNENLLYIISFDLFGPSKGLLGELF